MLRLLDVSVPAGRGRPLRGLRRSRQERHSKDATKLLLLYDDHILDNDPSRESKDVAFAQSYLRRVRAASVLLSECRCEEWLDQPEHLHLSPHPDQTSGLLL